MADIPLKQCTGCLKWRPATHHYFHRYTYRGKQRLRSRCKSCRSAERIEYYAKNQQVERQYQQVYIREHLKEHRIACREDRKFKRFLAKHPNGARWEEIGEYLGVTKQRAKQIGDAAIEKLRHPIIKKTLLQGLDDGDYGREIEPKY